MTNIQSGQPDLIHDDCDRAFGVSDAENVGERATRKKMTVHYLVVGAML
jgi:hypothetical protein